MRKNVFLILICSTVLMLLFQNFSVPTRVLPLNKKFESHETDPAKRIRDYLKFEIGDEAFSELEKLKSKLRIEWGGRDPAAEQEETTTDLKNEKTDPLKYTFSNLKTLRVRDDNSELNCRVESNGVSLSYHQQLNSTTSYIIEHNTEQQKSQAKFQLSW